MSSTMIHSLSLTSPRLSFARSRQVPPEIAFRRRIGGPRPVRSQRFPGEHLHAFA